MRTRPRPAPASRTNAQAPEMVPIMNVTTTESAITTMVVTRDSRMSSRSPAEGFTNRR